VTTFEAVGVTLVAVLPGALFVWGFERVVGRWAIGLSERILRFLGISAVLHALAAPISYSLWITHLKTSVLREALPLWFWPVTLAYVMVPVLLGSGLAVGFKRDKRWALLLTGPEPAPTAWDALFGAAPTGWVLMRLKSKRWIGGAYDEETSYVGGYPEPADIYLAPEALVDQQTETFVRDDAGEIVRLDFGVLVRWDEVEYLEVTPLGDTEEGSQDQRKGDKHGVQADQSVDDEKGLSGGEGGGEPQDAHE